MEKKKVLFVCLGNICRSPAAEGVFKYKVKELGLEYAFEIDSAGTAGYHAGEPADRRMQQHALKRGYKLTSISRKFNPSVDFDKFDLVVAMDNENVSNLKRMARSPEDVAKISKMTDFSKTGNYTEIPDPYYGGSDGFELVLDLLEDACEGLLERLS